MKKNLFTLGLLLLLLSFCVGLISCDEKAPDLSKKERDPRLIGAWTYIGNRPEQILEGDKAIEFKADGSCVGFGYPGGKRLFYTKGNDHLYLFVYGLGLKLANRTYEEYYLIERDTLYIWGIEEDMLARNYDRALAYTRTPKP